MYLSRSFSMCGIYTQARTHSRLLWHEGSQVRHLKTTGVIVQKFPRSLRFWSPVELPFPHPHCPCIPPSKFDLQGKSLVHRGDNLFLMSLMAMGQSASQASCCCWPPVPSVPWGCLCSGKLAFPGWGKAVATGTVRGSMAPCGV